MLHPHKSQAIAAALQDHASLSENPQEAVPLADYIKAELHRLSLSESVDEQLRILDDSHGDWVAEDVIVSAMDALRKLTHEQGYEPSESQQDRLRAHGFRPTDETAIQAVDVRRFGYKTV